MNVTRRAQIDRLYAEVLALPAASRAAYLARATQGDAELAQAVKSLLDAPAAELTLEPSQPGEVVQQTELSPANLQAGTTLGPYQILSTLGVGGMGEVYLAQDEQLKRKLALKLLPRQYVADAARIERFAREARAVSALNHPNIVTVYDIGELEGAHFIAMEYVKGQTLREACAAGPLSVKEAVEIVVQIAAALAAAHAAGIVHRDLKPENVMVRRDGYIKVLDFGLVKLIERERSAGETQASDAQLLKTNPGTVLGTVRYMSPEQALGEEVDRRSDIFSLGVLLYELLASVPPFKGLTTASLLDAIVHHQPLALAQVRPGLPVELERIVGRMLEKDRSLRYQTADDVRAVLKRLQREMDSASQVALTRRVSSQSQAAALAGKSWPRIWKKSWFALAGVLVFAVSMLAWRWLGLGKPADTVSWSRAAASSLTNFAGPELFPAFSPDGKEFVFARNSKDNWDIYQQRLSGLEPRNLTADSPADDTQPAYSSDGEWIAFRSEREGGGIFVMGATGDAPRKISDLGYYPDWSPDGKEIIFTTVPVVDPFSRGANARLYAYNRETGQRRELAAGNDAVQARWSPRGLRIAYWAKDERAQRDIWTVSPKGGDPVRVTNDNETDWNPVWAPDGRSIYFISNRKGTASLWRIPVDEASGRATGLPEPALGPLTQIWQLNLTRDGRRLAYVERQLRENIYVLKFDPQRFKVLGEAEPVIEGTLHSSAPDLSPDGQLLTYYTRGETNEDVFVSKVDGTERRQLTEDPAEDRLPRWTADGKRLLFYSKASGHFELWNMNADGSGRRQLSFNQGRSLVYPVLSPDGHWISYCIAGGSTFLLDAAKSWQEQTPLALPFIKPKEEWFIAWSWSPDSKKLAGWSSNSNGELFNSYVYSLDTQQFDKIAEVGLRQYWLSDNRHLICVQNDKLYLLDSQTKTTRLLLTMPGHEIRGATISADRDRIYYSLVTDESDIRLLTLE
jgi:Tol biopolymer transport system component/tRNA A-37 threonylcarbamoyl transferase component Bud32